MHAPGRVAQQATTYRLVLKDEELQLKLSHGPDSKPEVVSEMSA